jgi:hypothetical protein
MSFNSQKSLFLELEWSGEELLQLKEILPFEVEYLEEGFKYLGFFLKPNCYTLVDWSWIINKIKKRTSNWCHRWLTLGDIFTLVKSFLENIHVFWISMDNIPKGMLNRIQRRMFNFLWIGIK